MLLHINFLVASNPCGLMRGRTTPSDPVPCRSFRSHLIPGLLVLLNHLESDRSSRTSSLDHAKSPRAMSELWSGCVDDLLDFAVRKDVVVHV